MVKQPKTNKIKIKKKQKNKSSKSSKNIKKKQNKTKKLFKRDQCAPRNKFYFTCYSNDALINLRDKWNTRHEDNKIESNDPQTIWKKLKNFMKNTCYRESCWLRKNFIKYNLDDELLHYTFAPKYPNEWKMKPNEWLSSVDILNVMHQYEKKFKEFEFMGPSPIDYDLKKHHGECVWDELCKFNLMQLLKKNKNKVGIIFNLDKHYQSGSHWVAVFLSMDKKEIYYFDSYGDKPPANILGFIKNIQKQGENIGCKIKYLYNTNRHQYGDSECGMYCLYFIISMLQYGGNFQHFLETKISDKEVMDLRKVYFNY
jgi:hypothetical protein